RFVFQTAVELDRVLEELGDAGGAAELSDEARGVVRGSARQLAALEHHDVLPPELRQMVGGAAPNDAASDDDGSRMAGEGAHAHAVLPSMVGGARRGGDRCLGTPGRSVRIARYARRLVQQVEAASPRRLKRASTRPHGPYKHTSLERTGPVVGPKPAAR